MDIMQIVLTVVVAFVGLTLVLVGIQLFFVLKDLRKNLEQTTRILTDVEKISSRAVEEQRFIDDILGAVSQMVGAVSGMTQSVGAVGRALNPATTVGLSVLQIATKILQRHKHEEGYRNGRTN
jgi:hypothetical protein